MPEIERYTGIGCPRIHLRLYSTVMRAHGLDEAQMIMLFPMSLSGAAQRWFASLDVSRRRTWDDLAQEFLRQFAFNTVIDVSRRELEALRQRPDETVTSFISRWREKIAQIIDRPLEREETHYWIETRDVSAISAVRPRPPRYYQTVGQTSGVYYPPSPHVQYRSPVPFRPMSPTYLHSAPQPVYATQTTQRPPAHYPQPRAPPAPRPMRQFSQLGMPLSRDFQKLIEGGLLTALAPRPPPQPLPPQFRMDLHCAYHQGPGHDTDRCSALRHAIQDLIDQGLVNLGQPSVTTNPLPAHTTHSVPPPTGGIHHMDFVQDDVIHMLSWDDGLPEMIVPDDGYEIGHVRSIYSMPEDVDVQVMTRSGRIAQAAPPVTRPFGGTDSREEIRVETSTTPEGLIHMMTADRATCILFSADDLPPEGSDHTRPLYITVICSGHRVSSVLLDNGSALNVCPLATAIALGFAPQILAGAIPSSLHQKVKFIHDGQVITVQSTRDMISSSEPVLQISHSDDDFFLTGFTFDEVQTLEIQDFCRDFVAMSFDQHSSTLVLDMMRGMSFLPGFGLGRRQHGSSEFVTSIDHETPYGLGFTPSEDDVCYMSRLRRDRVRARLFGIPFDYPVRPYTFSLADYFVKGSKVQPRVEEIGVDDSTLGELQHVFHQMQLGDETPDMSASVMILPPSPDRASLFSLCFLDETTDYGQFLDTVQCEPFSPLELSGVSVIEIAEEDQTVPAPELSDFVIPTIDMYEGTVGPIEGASDSVDPPLSFDILSGFVTRFDYVSDDSVKDLSIYEYSSVSCDDVSLFAPYPLTSQIFDINDEIAQLDSDDQPRELKIGLPLSTDERNRLIHLLRSYLDVFAWSYEDMLGLDPSIVQHHLPILPHAKPVKQKLRRLHPRWSLHVKEEIQKQLSVGFISVVKYPEWLSNVVPVPKKDDKVRVMSFGLKNAGATYQRAATALFHDMMHRDVEVLRLNPKKCTFGVTSGKLLGHMVSERGIEVDPDKIKAILDMPVPRTEKEIRGFLGRLQYISRFIARLTDICEPIFRLLRKNQPTVWNDDCQLAFERIKEYLLSPPVLVPPMPGRPLLLYLSVSDIALGCMLAQLDDLGKERAIYYLTLVWATRRLRHYMTEYSVHLISRLDPLRYLFDRPALAGRLMRWLVLLTEFDIHYVSQKSIKGSVVANHLASLPIIESRPIDDDFPDEEFVAMTRLSRWHMYFDGAANHSGDCIRAWHHTDGCTGDSNLVLRQVQGDWKTRDAKLKPYHAYLELLIEKFES
ncbi:Retrovirus-related Pol polyprotein from transposon 17.6 [Vitis vinifera]|uniref:Retrovirus-related Pol polyprotein from transposon 17.6 n=1 Tax=Vitis vinifera TaxID=29760 RepID=A0A438JGX7_VITVI|nr:Retrovirus-related Pol polyprotein from transposon 17.6 [Vitis vinifera]